MREPWRLYNMKAGNQACRGVPWGALGALCLHILQANFGALPLSQFADLQTCREVNQRSSIGYPRETPGLELAPSVATGPVTPGFYRFGDSRGLCSGRWDHHRSTASLVRPASLRRFVDLPCCYRQRNTIMHVYMRSNFGRKIQRIKGMGIKGNSGFSKIFLFGIHVYTWNCLSKI